jgi:hypothetical protein
MSGFLAASWFGKVFEVKLVVFVHPIGFSGNSDLLAGPRLTVMTHCANLTD